MARDYRSLAAFVALWWSSSWCFGSMPGDTRPMRTARPASSIPDSALLQSINEIEDAEKRMKAFQSIMQILQERDVLQERMEQEKVLREIDVLRVRIEKEKVLRERDVLQVRMEKFEEDLLRAKGLMTARGVFERVAQLAFHEQKKAGNMKGKCITANVLPIASKHPEAGCWSELLHSSAKECDSTQIPEDALQQVWTLLSNQVHNPSWGDVKIDPNLPEGTRCIVKKLCEKMGLEVVP